MSWLFIGWWTTGQFVLYVLTYRTWAICAEVWMGYSYTYGMEFISKGGVKISDICGEMNPLVFSLVFSALEEVNLVFILMMSSTVMVDIVFARFMFCTFYWR